MSAENSLKLRERLGLTEMAALGDAIFPREQRRLSGLLGVIVSVAAVGLAVFTLWMAFNVTIGPIKTRAAHLMIVIPMTFILYPMIAGWRDRKPTLLDIAMAIAAFAAFLWAVMSAERYEERFAYYDEIETLDIIFGLIAIFAIFEATRRTVGMTIVILNCIFMAYALTGPYWPGLFEHKGTTVLFLVEHLYMLSDGIFNFIMGIMATFLFTFLLFGAFLRACGGDRIFTSIAMAIAGHRKGGPAKVAIISSAMMGMLSGSTVSNVATTGALTIPMMKRTGFKNYEAAAIESVSSLGGALMPPVMGAGVFIMAAFTGLPLVTIMAYSLGPALLYFASIYVYIDIKARSGGLEGLPRSELPSLRETLMEGGHIFLPIAVLIGLLVMNFTPFYASAACVVLLFFISHLRSATRMNFAKLWIALEAGTRVALTVAALSASAAIIYGVITATGLLVKVSSIILSLSGGDLATAIVLIALMSYVMGMGLPVTASYVLLAALGAPALAELGVSLLAAHLIIFWFSQDSTITPPICMTAFVAARIAEAPPMRTGWEAVKLAKALYIMPFMFAFSSILGDSVPEMFFDFGVLLLALVMLPVAVEGYLSGPVSWTIRLGFLAVSMLFIIAALGTFSEGWAWAAAGVAAGLPLVYFSLRQARAAGVEQNMEKLT